VKLQISIIKILFLVCVVFGTSEHCYALPESTLNYQGRLTNRAGNIVSDGYYGVRFSIYDSENAINSLWTETKNVYTRNGIFSTVLGTENRINIAFNDSMYYLGIKVGADSEMSPRIRIGASPFAINSMKLDGMEAGTGANNVLKLNEYGEVDISGKIKSSGGISISSGNVDLPNNSIQGSYIAPGAINNEKISASAGISYSKLNLSSSIQGADLRSNININTSGSVSAGSLTMNGNITFGASTNTIAGIQNQNLLDLSANETITGEWTFDNNIAVADGQWVGLGATDARILFTEVGATDSITIQNANLLMENNSWIGISNTVARIAFNTGGPSGTLYVTGNMQVSDGIQLIGGTRMIGVGGDVDDGRIIFTSNTLPDIDDILVYGANFRVAGSNNYYTCTSEPNCTQVPTAIEGRTVTVRNNSGNAVNQFNAIDLVKGSDGNPTSIGNGEYIYAVYNGSNWVIIGQGH
jgi:hypothetical protein